MKKVIVPQRTRGQAVMALCPNIERRKVELWVKVGYNVSQNDC
jgi:hypothetical protein